MSRVSPLALARTKQAARALPEAAMANDHILTFTCPDKPGIVHAVTGVLAAHKLNVLDLQQFSDASSHKFFMRVHFGPTETADTGFLREPFDALAAELNMADGYSITPAAHRTRTLIMVSKTGHCLNDLLFRNAVGPAGHRRGRGGVQPRRPRRPGAVVRRDLRPPAGWRRPRAAAQEAAVLDLIREHDVELVVLARYMQILSPALCSAMSGRIINIHHSFLPSFKGARPYHQAYARGVKIIGATAPLRHR